MTREPIKRGPALDHDGRGMEPDIIQGAKNNDIDEVQMALRKNKRCINQQETEYGLTALHYAATRGNLEMVDFLLEQDGLDMGLADRWQRDSLDAAILAGHSQIIDALFLARQGLPRPDRSGPK